MKKYKRRISFETLILTFRRRYKVLLMLFIPLSFISFFSCQYFIEKTYLSDAVIVSNKDIYVDTYSIFPETILSDSTANIISNVLESKDIHHSNGTHINQSEIQDGLIIDSSIKNLTKFIAFSFCSTDKTIVQSITHEVANYITSLESLNTRFGGLSIYQEASEIKKTSKENQSTIICVALSFVASVIVSFFVEVISDEVYGNENYDIFRGTLFELYVNSSSSSKRHP